jgi:hypothetical protein
VLGAASVGVSSGTVGVALGDGVASTLGASLGAAEGVGVPVALAAGDGARAGLRWSEPPMPGIDVPVLSPAAPPV